MHPFPNAWPRLSRRAFFRMAAGASAAAATLPILTEAHLAHAEFPKFADPNKGIHIDANENPLGPSDAARQAVLNITPRGGRYLFNMEQELAELFAHQEGLSPDSVRVYAGSSEPLHYSVLAFTDKSRPLVIADPGYEAPLWAAQASGAPIFKVSLADPRGAATHDIKAMLAATQTPGLLYICNPNNPTGTCTPRSDLEYAVEHAPRGTVLLIDEAYIHLCDQPRSIGFVKQGRDVIVLRTFSKLYGMAGLRMGFAVGRPDLLKKLDYFGQNPLPITALAAARASLLEPDLVPSRQKYIAGVRAETMTWLKSKGYAMTPSESNCFMLDTGKPGKQVMDALAAKDIYIGRIWPAWPNHVRITVGTHEEMLAFTNAFAEVMANPTASGDHRALGQVRPDRPLPHWS